MADYDCDDCRKHVSYGGKCRRYQSSCAFTHLERGDKEEMESLKEALKLVDQAKKIIEHIYEHGEADCEYEQSLLSSAYDELEEKTNSALVKEWEEILS